MIFTIVSKTGIPYPVVANIMGWSAATAIRMAKRYGRIGHKAMRDAMEVLGDREIQVESLKKSPKWQASEPVSCSKYMKGLAPQVGLEPTTLRLTEQ